MNRLIWPAILIAVALVPGPKHKNYVITINGTSQELALGEAAEVILEDGTKLSVKLDRKEYLVFEGEYFSFEHHNSMSPTRQEVDNGIHQTIVMNPMGTGIIVQEYNQINPSALIDLMIVSLTSEEVAAGYTKSSKEAVMKVGDVEFKGKKAITRSRHEKWTRGVYAYGKGTKGVLIVTFVEEAQEEKDRSIHQRFWESFRLDPALLPD